MISLVLWLLTGNYFVLLGFSLSFFVICLFGSIYCCKLLQKGLYRNICFCCILLLGIICHTLLTKQIEENSSGITAAGSVAAEKGSSWFFWKEIFKAVHHSHITTAAFFPSRGTYNIEDDGTLGDEKFTVCNMMVYIAFHALVYIFAGYFVMSLWGFRTINRLWFWLTADSEKNTFWCKEIDGKMMTLAESIKTFQNGKYSVPVFSVDEDSVPDSKNLFREMNYHQYLLKLRKPGNIHSDCINAPKHFFISDDYTWNIEMASKVLKAVKERSSGLAKADFYVRISGGLKDYWAVRWAEEISKCAKQKGPCVEIHLLKESELIARTFVKDNPLLDSPGIETVPDTGKVKGSFKILLLGFSELGENILRETVCDGQFLHISDTDSFSVDVIDDCSRNFDLFAARCKEAVEQYNISFYEKDPCSGDFYKFAEEKISSYNRIIVAFEDKKVCMDSAAQIVEIAKVAEFDLNTRLFVNFPDSGPEEKNSLFREFTAFGSLKECYSKEVIINEKLDDKAKLINFYYGKTEVKTDDITLKNEIEAKWCELSFFNRESNRSAAAGLYNLCRLMGIKDPENNFDKKLYDRVRDLKLMNVYCENEHLRWSAFHYMRGIRKWDVSGLEKIERANDIKEHNRHAALVSYAELPSIDKKVEKESDLQKNNEMNIELIVPIFSTGKILEKRNEKQ